MARSRALVVTALLSFGLGIGVNAVVFSLAVELLSVSQASPMRPRWCRCGSAATATRLVALDFLRRSGMFQDVVGDNARILMNFDNGTETRPVLATAVTKNYFTALGVPVAHGRGILPDDPSDVVVIGDRFWRRRFNGDLSIVGSHISLEGRPFTVVGILPPCTGR